MFKGHSAQILRNTRNTFSLNTARKDVGLYIANILILDSFEKLKVAEFVLNFNHFPFPLKGERN